jgi:hypothetical protein
MVEVEQKTAATIKHILEDSSVDESSEVFAYRDRYDPSNDFEYDYL